MRDMSKVGDRIDEIDCCPVCGKQYRAVMGPRSKLTSPDTGDWCFVDGWFYTEKPEGLTSWNELIEHAKKKNQMSES